MRLFTFPAVVGMTAALGVVLAIVSPAALMVFVGVLARRRRFDRVFYMRLVWRSR